MSMILNGLQLAGSILRCTFTTRVVPARLNLSSSVRFQETNVKSSGEEEEEENKQSPQRLNEQQSYEHDKLGIRVPSKGPVKTVSLEESIRYLQSDAYKQTYGENPVWKLYRRNHKGGFAPKKTRKTCYRAGVITTSNPCPLCRDEYLLLDPANTDLLKQFISEYNGEILSYTKTGVCQRKHNRLLVCIYQARNTGQLVFDVPFRQYDYSEWQEKM